MAAYPARPAHNPLQSNFHESLWLSAYSRGTIFKRHTLPWEALLTPIVDARAENCPYSVRLRGVLSRLEVCARVADVAIKNFAA